MCNNYNWQQNLIKYSEISTEQMLHLRLYTIYTERVLAQDNTGKKQNVQNREKSICTHDMNRSPSKLDGSKAKSGQDCYSHRNLHGARSSGMPRGPGHFISRQGHHVLTSVVPGVFRHHCLIMNFTHQFSDSSLPRNPILSH